MAVIQISRIQHRRGLATQEGLPQLASGEIGWAIDQQRLFIGNGSVAEGAPAVGNTEVLTESRMFELLSTENFTSATNYTYKGHFPSVSIHTGPDSNSPVVRTLQEVLDDNVTVLNFGAADQTDSTQAIQRAITETFNNVANRDQTSSRLPVRIPAGEYYFTGTVYLPPNTTIVGDGIDKTVLIAIGPNTTIFETSDVDGNTGLDIIDQPINISMSGMTLSYGTATNTATCTPLLVLDSVANSSISKVKFAGEYNPDVFASTSSYSAISLRGTGNLTRNLKLTDLEFYRVCYPAIANNDMTDIEISNSKFNDLYQGITLASNVTGSSPNQFGPRNVNIKYNKFSNIEKQAVYAGPNTGTNNQIVLEGNLYHNVGNDGSGDENPITSIISLLSHGNSTINDNFERLWNAQSGVAATVAQKPAVEGTLKVELSIVDRKTIVESTVTETLIRIPLANTVTSITIDYTLEKDSVYRKGTISVVGGQTAASLRDSYNVAGLNDGDTAFFAELVDTESLGSYDTLAVQYDNPVSAGTGTIVYNVSYYK